MARFYFLRFCASKYITRTEDSVLPCEASARFQQVFLWAVFVVFEFCFCFLLSFSIYFAHGQFRPLLSYITSPTCEFYIFLGFMYLSGQTPRDVPELSKSTPNPVETTVVCCVEDCVVLSEGNHTLYCTDEGWVTPCVDTWPVAHSPCTSSPP